MGERFGHYEIMRRLAAGGMAEVLLAKQTSLGGFERLVCLKRILAHLSGQEEFLRMFMDEARIAANLVHPNVAQIYDISQQDNQYYIAMEYVRGEDLRRVYNQEVGLGHAIPKHVAALVIMGAAAGLDYAHRQTDLTGAPLGIVHRDVSPQNILVTYDGHVKLIDFGVAKAAGKLNQTRAGVLKGKYSYMSPEQASGDPLDGRTDIFALGITLYEITTGTRLFKRDNELETLHAVIACNVKPPSQVVPNYDEDLERIVLRALAYDVDSRYTTAGEMEHDLERYLLHRGHPTSATSLSGYMQGLFAEKLADEALFGGPPWNEAATQSRQARGSGAIEGSHSLTPSMAQAAADGAGGTRVSSPGDEPTVVDPPPKAPAEPVPDQRPVAQSGRATAPKDGSVSKSITPPEWRQVPERPEQTLPTQSQSSGGEEATVVPGAAGTSEGPGPDAHFPLPMGPSDRPTAKPQQPETERQTPQQAALQRPLMGAALALVLCAAGLGLWRHRSSRLNVSSTDGASMKHAAGHAATAPQALGRQPGDGPGDHSKPSGADEPSDKPPGSVVRAPGPQDGVLTVEAPVPMAVWLGTTYLGTTPLKDVVLPGGTLLLKLENRRDGGMVMRTVHLRAKGRQRLVVGPERGLLDVEGRPWAWLQMGQHPAQETPAHLELLVGDYLVTTECPSGERTQQTVRVSEQQPTRLVIRCAP